MRFASSNQVSHRPYIDEHEKILNSPTQEYSYNRSHLWRPSSPTVVYIGTIPFGLAVIEMTEAVLMRYVNGKYIRESEYTPPKASRRYPDHTWTTTENIPCGRLRLVIYSPHRAVSWSLSFQERAGRTLTQDIAKIVKSIKSSTGVLQEKIQEAEHQARMRQQQWEADRARWRREEDQRQIAKSISDSREQLSQVIQSWAKVVSIEQFFKGVEERASTLSETRREALQERLRLAREFIGVQDPLNFFLSWRTPGERYTPLIATAAQEDR